MSLSLAKRLIDYLRPRQMDMTQLLIAMTELESPSHLPESQHEIQTLLTGVLAEFGYRVRHLSGQQTGGHLLAVPYERRRGQPSQLLLGHTDTVWPLGTKQQMPIELRDGRLHGPGVYDMKGGLVQTLFALKAIRELGVELQVTPILFVNSDEEIGSPESSRFIRRLARRVDRTFVMEPSLGPEGRLKTTRKGVGRFHVRVIGRAAHAGLQPEQGASAILELSHVVQQLFAMNDPDRGVAVNVGTIAGGLRRNVIAPESNAEVGVRVATQEDAEEITATILSLQPTTPGTRLEISGQFDRPPMERTPGNERLWQLAREAADELGLEIDEGAAGGGSDGNSTSLFTPTLDGLGAVGDGAHADTEFVYVDQMTQRAALLARLLAAPAMRSDGDAD